MPVALRTRSWEDHVTPNTRKQYSYDDLDLVCCHANVGGSHSPKGRRRRERCASMPECCRNRPGSESCPGEDRNKRRRTLSGTFKAIAASIEGRNSQRFTKGHTFLIVRKAMADDDITQTKDSPSSRNCSAPISNPFLHESLNEKHKKDKDITSKTKSRSSGSSSANTIEEQAKKLDFSTTAKTKDVAIEMSFSEIIPNSDVTMGLTGTPETNREPMVEVNVGDPVVGASALQQQQVLRVDVEATITVSDKSDRHDEHSDAVAKTDLTAEVEQSDASQIPKNSVVPDVIVNIPNSNNDQVVTSDEVLQAHNLDACKELESCPSGNASDPDRYKDCHSKLDTIPEASFTELGEEAVGVVMEDMSGTTLVDLKGAGNSNGSSGQVEMLKDTPEAGVLGSFQTIITGVSADCESSLESRTEGSDHVMILQTSPNMDDAERDPKAQEVPVRLRTRKVRNADLLTEFVSFSQG